MLEPGEKYVDKELNMVLEMVLEKDASICSALYIVFALVK